MISLQAIIAFGFNRTLVLTAGGKFLVVGAGEVTSVSQSGTANLASSQMDPLQAKAEPIITYLRKGKKCGMAAVRGVRNTWQKQPCRLEVSVEGGGGVAPGARAEILSQPVGKTR